MGLQFYSTKNRNYKASLKEAVLSGLAKDGGLFMPSHIPKLETDFLKKIIGMKFSDIAFEVAKKFFENEIENSVLEKIIYESFNFEVPIFEVSNGAYVMELFHGPTLAFKDFAARFMARLMCEFQKESDKELTILVATSGDTGSAVASAFLGLPNIKVVILYPSKKISLIQEKQLTTFGQNVSALELDGTFDDCQTLAKKAFLDPEVNQKLSLASANSINIARLIPQSFYYFYAYATLMKLEESRAQNEIVISVPSGNFGNLTGGLIAKKMGLPVSRFIASTNSNNVFTKYLESGIFEARVSKSTISNAMDVGNPSNFARVLDLYNHDLEAIKKDIVSFSFSDEETKAGILEIYEKYKYIMDPHGAVAYLGLKKSQYSLGVFVETAHPAKFADIVEPIINQKIPFPKQLEVVMKKEKHSIRISSGPQGLYENFKSFLM